MNKQIVMIKTEQLEHHPDNPRKNIGDITELTSSIATDGILQNLTIVPKPEDTNKYYVVIGNRRLEAGTAAGLTEFPCVISDMDYNKQLETMLIENINRSDLTPLEEAEGFKQLTLAGYSVDDIADKTGFSKSTINRRLKLNDYDRKKVAAAQERGATLNDFAKLEQIKVKSERNKLLKLIGTADFNLEYKRSYEQQKRDEFEKLALKELKTFAEPFPDNEDYWSNKWIKSETFSYPLMKFEKGKRVPKNKSKKYYYKILRYYGGNIDINIYTQNKDYVESESTRKPKKTEKQKATDRAVRVLNKIAREHYELRKEFVMSLANRSNIKDYEHICLDTIIKKVSEYGYISNNFNYNKILCELFGVDNLYGSNATLLLDAYKDHPAGTAVAIVYRLLEDSEFKNCYHKYSDSSKVVFSENKGLNKIYDFLIAVGYELSEEENQIINGTYELYESEDKH